MKDTMYKCKKVDACLEHAIALLQQFSKGTEPHPEKRSICYECFLVLNCSYEMEFYANLSRKKLRTMISVAM